MSGQSSAVSPEPLTPEKSNPNNGDNSDHTSSSHSQSGSPKPKHSIKKPPVEIIQEQPQEIVEKKGVNHLLHFVIALCFPPWICVYIVLLLIYR